MPSPGLYCPHDIERDPRALGLRSQTVETAFGRLYFARSAHERRGETATVFLHGVGGSWQSWTPLLQEARRRGVDFGDVLLVDLPGFGASENRLPHLKSRAVGEALIQAAREAGFSRLRLVGHSMGGFLALDLASHHFPELEAVASLSGAYYSIVDTVQRPLRALARQPTSTLVYGALASVSLFGRFGVGLTRSLHRAGLLPMALRHVVAHPYQLREDVLTYLTENLEPASFSLAAANGYGYDCQARWGQIRIPVWAGFGERDRMVPLSDRERLLHDLPGARAEILEGVGHFGNLERPDLVVRALDAFFAQA